MVDVVLAAIELLRCEILRCSETSALKRIRKIRQSEVSRKPEVDYYGVPIFANAYVVWLNIAMNNLLLS